MSYGPCRNGVTADVIILTSGSPVNGKARFEVQINNAQVGTYDRNNEWKPQKLDESDFPYFFSRNSNGEVTEAVFESLSAEQVILLATHPFQLAAAPIGSSAV